MEKGTKKWLYEFEAKEVVKKEDGSQETKIKKFAILKANRRLREDGELFYAAETSRFAKAGVLPKAAWGTILSNGGGSVSDDDRESYGNLLIGFRDLSFELQTILVKGESDRSESEKKRSDELFVELDRVKDDIQSFESSQINIFENTAEAKARNRTILWWVLFLSHEESEGGYKPIFDEKDFNDKLDQYDVFEDGDGEYEFILGVLRRFTYLITLWFLGRAETDEDFDSFDKNFLKDSTKESAVEEVVEKTESKDAKESSAQKEDLEP